MQVQPPPGALAPGTKLAVGSHNVRIKSYISEGGFAHVYVVRSSPPTDDGNDIACLKRVLVPDKILLNLLRAEVDSMKRLCGHKNIVKYIDSHASRMSNGSEYEVLLLMEYCSGNGLIDFMNTRLQEQLTESEILKIMGDITCGLACMHYLQPPLIHRDLKIENVLISGDGTYKLCDFGSASPILRPPKNSTEFHILEEDIQHHTTAQYRSPEMIDIYRGFPIDEKCDIWALGVFLYKLCYYTTPFERDGQLAILHAKFSFPSRPAYSDRLKRIVTATLNEDPRNRPNVYQVLKEVCSMRGIEVPIKDIYSSQIRMPIQQPIQSPPNGLTPVASLTNMVVKVQEQMQQNSERKIIPEVQPMFRGRVKVQSEDKKNGDDPFALLDKPKSKSSTSLSVPSVPSVPSPSYRSLMFHAHQRREQVKLLISVLENMKKSLRDFLQLKNLQKVLSNKHLRLNRLHYLHLPVRQILEFYSHLKIIKRSMFSSRENQRLR